MTPPVALTIAGSDSGGGAGIQADLKTFAAHQVFGTSALAAVTAQSTTRVSGVHVLPAEFVVAQIEAVVTDLPVRSVKTGMLATTEIVHAVAELAASGRLPDLVVDPVMVASAGDRLLDADAEAAYIEQLLPHARVATPNLWEAQVLLGRTLETLDDVRAGAAELRATGCDVVVIKGGHPTPDAAELAVDVWCDADGIHELSGPRVDTPNNHGSGCSFAAAVAARLVQGDDVATALAVAKDYVARAMAGGARWRLGAGHGPIDHFFWEETT